MGEATLKMLDGVGVFKLADVPGAVEFVEFKVVLVIVVWRKEQALQPAKEGKKRETHRGEGEVGGSGRCR